MNASLPRLLIIGTYWSLTVLRAISAIHHLQIDWIVHNPTCYFEHFRPMTAEYLSSLGHSAYDLPVLRMLHHPQKPWWCFKDRLYHNSKPSLKALQDLWPHLRNISDLNRYEFISNHEGHDTRMAALWAESRIQWSEEELLLDTTHYDGIMLMSPHTELWQCLPKAAHTAFNKIPWQPHTLYCVKASDGSISLNKSAQLHQENIQWSVWEEGGWREQWFQKNAIALWAIDTPFYIEKFLNQKKLFESFVRKISFHARQTGIRVR